jgi:hypothetical protein
MVAFIIHNLTGIIGIPVIMTQTDIVLCTGELDNFPRVVSIGLYTVLSIVEK